MDESLAEEPGVGRKVVVGLGVVAFLLWLVVLALWQPWRDAESEPTGGPAKTGEVEPSKPVDPAARHAAELERLLAQGAGSTELKRMILEIENEELEPSLRELPATKRFVERARKLLGEDAYEDLVALGMVEEEEQEDPLEPRETKEPTPEPTPEPKPPDDAEETIPWRTSVRRGSAERRTRFQVAAIAARERVKAARRAIRAELRARAARVAVEARRAMRRSEPLDLPPHQGAPGGRGKLLRYGERRFELEVAGKRRSFSWVDAPASTACDLLERALDPNSADDQMRIGARALVGGLFARANQRFARARKLDPSIKVPDVATFERLARVFQAPGLVSNQRIRLTYAFDDARETSDWETNGTSWASVRAGAMTLQSWFPSYKDAFAYATHRGTFADAVTLTVDARPYKGRLLVGLGSDLELVVGEGGIGLAHYESARDARLKGSVRQDVPISLRLVRVGKRTRLTVKQGASRLVDELIDLSWPLRVGLGVVGAAARVTRVELSGRPDAAWLARRQDEIPFLLELALERWEQKQTAGSAKQGLLPLRFAVTSAEDDECLAGVPTRARDLVARARQAIARRGPGAGADLLRRAQSMGGGSYWAVEYLLARVDISVAEHATSLEQAHLRLDQAIAGVEDFYEALAARSTVLLRQGRLREARRDAEKALEIRADYAPARLALAYVCLQEGNWQTAVEEARLAARLSGRRSWSTEVSRLLALREGPSWNEHARRETKHYVVHTDMTDRVDEFAKVLESVRREAPRIYPTLKARPGAVKRKPNVFLFKRAEDFYRHAYRTSGDRSESSAGYFSPRSGHLMLYDGSSRGILWVLRHEATHQWVHSLGLALPYWANEAVADYVGGFDATTGKSRPGLPELKRLMKEAKPPFELYDLMTSSPSEFYSGQTFTKYCQAWSFVHYCMQGGDKALRKTFLAYLRAHTRGQAGDKSRQIGVRLEHIYASTFHQLDMKQISARWWAYVRRLGKDAGIK